ncbi:MAG: ribonuclease III [Pseudomonadota bacterium]
MDRLIATPAKDLAQHAARLSSRLGRTVTPSPRLQEALTHPSASSRARPDNQRLEFLGDRVLGLVLAQALFARFPDASEGDLAPRYNALVRRETCAEMAEALDLGAMLRLGRSEALAGGRRKTAILADAMEAVIAAIYLDDGMEAAGEVILTLWAARVDGAAATPTDAKTALQEWAQARGLPPPDYPTLDRDGPDHAPVFTVAARLAGGEEATASAPSKRAAQQAAAAALLSQIEGEGES